MLQDALGACREPRRVIAGLTPERPVCRFCGYECGLVGTGCGYMGVPDMMGRRSASDVLPYTTPTFIILAPLSKDEPPVDLGPELPRKPLRTQKPRATAFVGGGAMRRRWR